MTLLVTCLIALYANDPPIRLSLRERIAEEAGNALRPFASEMDADEIAAVQDRLTMLFTRPLDRLSAGGPDEALAAWYLDSVIQVLQTDFGTLRHARSEAFYEYWEALTGRNLPAHNIPLEQRQTAQREFETTLDAVARELSACAAAASDAQGGAVDLPTEDRIRRALWVPGLWRLSNYFYYESVRTFNAASRSGEAIVAAMRSAHICGQPMADNEGFYMSVLAFANSLGSVAIGEPQSAGKSPEQCVEALSANLARLVKGDRAWDSDPANFLEQLASERRQAEAGEPAPQPAEPAPAAPSPPGPRKRAATPAEAPAAGAKEPHAAMTRPTTSPPQAPPVRATTAPKLQTDSAPLRKRPGTSDKAPTTRSRPARPTTAKSTPVETTKPAAQRTGRIDAWQYAGGALVIAAVIGGVVLWRFKVR